MAITETTEALGSWSVQLKANTPKKIIDILTDQPANPAYFGHICVHTGRINPKIDGDPLLKTSRYTGVYRGKSQAADDSYTLTGVGMSVWLGDEDGKGQCIESLVTITSDTFPNSIRALLPTSVHEGTLFTAGGATFSGTFQYTDPRTAVKYVCDTVGAEYRVNGDATIDAGLISDLYRTVPTCALVKRVSGRDMKLRGLPGQFSLAEDVDDFTTRVVLLAQGDGAATATGTADILPGENPYVDLFGNTLQMTRLVSESTTDTGNADARAQLNLSQYESPTDALTLSTTDFDIKGDLQVGDNLYVYDPDQGLVDNTNEVIFRSIRMNPIILRCTEATWPVAKGLSIMFRSPSGTWTDLTPWVVWETNGSTTVVVGGYNRSLTDTSEPIGSRPVADSSIPGVPTWSSPFQQTVYQSPLSGETKAQVQLVWTRPNNTDGTPIVDGDHYEIQYRNSATPIAPVTYTQLAAFSYAAINTAGGTYSQPIHYAVSNWQTAAANFDQLTFLLQELTPNMPYEAQIRAVDSANPPNVGAWSSITSWQCTQDSIPPAVPAPPSVASSLIAIQVTHTLGVAGGGTFNESLDLHHLEIHGAPDPSFTPSSATLLGKLIANAGMITGQIPVVGTFPVGDIVPVSFRVIAVDNAGNKSTASTPVSATAQLIDDEHISSLTVSKVTAGTISADMILAGSIKTGVTGARVEMNNLGLWGFDVNNNSTFHLSDVDGSLTLNLTDASGGALSVTDNGVQKFYVGTDRTIVRDRANNIIMSDDTTANWGYNTPNIQYAAYPTTNIGGQYINWVSGGVGIWLSAYTAVIPINNPRFNWEFLGVLGAGGVSTSCQYRVRISQAGQADVIQGAFTLGPSTTLLTEYAAGSYLFPYNSFGQFATINFELNYGSGNTAEYYGNIPYYMFGSGA